MLEQPDRCGIVLVNGGLDPVEGETKNICLDVPDRACAQALSLMLRENQEGQGKRRPLLFQVKGSYQLMCRMDLEEIHMIRTGDILEVLLADGQIPGCWYICIRKGMSMSFSVRILV